MAPLRRLLARKIREHTRSVLDTDKEPLAAELGELGSRTSKLQARLSTVDGRLRRLPLVASASMTIDQAWHLHPGAPEVFTRHHLPGCEGCAVRFDETIAEAAEAYGLDLQRFLDDLRALR